MAEADRLRDEIAAHGWEVRDVAERLRARAARVTRDLVYGRNAVREALRGPREVLEVWASERAARRSTGSATGRGRASKRERELTEAAGPPTTRASSPGASRTRYADAWELAAVERPLLCCLDQVTDPRNLGAVVRSAAGAGATGVVLPAHGAARRHRRPSAAHRQAPSSTCRSPSSRTSPATSAT